MPEGCSTIAHSLLVYFLLGGQKIKVRSLRSKLVEVANLVFLAMFYDTLTHLIFIFLLELLDWQRLALVLDHQSIILEVDLNFLEAVDVLIVLVMLDRHANIILLNRLFENRFEATSALLFLFLALDFELPGLLKHFHDLLLSLLHSNSFYRISHLVSSSWVVLRVIFGLDFWHGRDDCFFVHIVGDWCGFVICLWLLLYINELTLLWMLGRFLLIRGVKSLY